MAKTDKERLVTGFWNRIDSNQATDYNSIYRLGIDATWQRVHTTALTNGAWNNSGAHTKFEDSPRHSDGETSVDRADDAERALNINTNYFTQ